MVDCTFQATYGSGNDPPPLSVPVHPISFLLTTWQTSTCLRISEMKCRRNLCGSFQFVPPYPLFSPYSMMSRTRRTRTTGKRLQPEENRIILSYKPHYSGQEPLYTVLFTLHLSLEVVTCRTIGQHVTRHACHEARSMELYLP